MSRPAGIALGSNLGERLVHLQAARDFLREIAIGPRFLQASVYQTAPVACPDDAPDFLNTVVDFDFAGSPEELLGAALALESRLGRIRGTERHAPRTLDVDLLYLGDHQIASPQLDLPHPRLTQRRFVLEPLAEIRSEWRLPGDLMTIGQHLARLKSSEPPLQKVHPIW
ncbi:2-amino-4-hydroxy-6-hydroxymethyldihydropteridine diphosphokinase [Haloferula luteola]|uniref:2-amino-4-hydroxy-6-hydroxymethyldihydropteridine pyrophosphokinase n=1 Tax=Haloferula luteola TaxID=595692 RepID=A0A840VIQ9_9BACT|nr:2-amino-4-hydroxy-6-hydroxymethyldihydropteridine diphosphokinase [Haloferula luteola]MBB5352591.1 2-amino-4-hydroxy-6-hydroxymethyldihydropteridine diphosphokinase [Haloferula luteola]